MRHVFVLLCALPAALPAQHAGHGAPAEARRPAVELSQSRTASGTAWLPDAERVPGLHTTAGAWSLMLHGAAFLQYVRALGIRGKGQAGSANWAMLMAARPAAGGRLRVRVTATAEPWTLTGSGYPQLLQVAHEYRGQLAPDRQHPHELIAEVSAAYEWAASDGLALSAYAAPVGEPALGPVAYNHRPSAAYEPTAPLGHLVQDYTHESLGVITVGAFGRHVRVEASLFNGSHPDDERTNLDLQGGRLDAVAARLTLAPSAGVTAAVWFGAIPAAGGPHPHGASRRFGASWLHARPRAGGSWSSALLYAGIKPRGEAGRHTVLVESTLDLTPAQAVFGRVEYVRRTAEELALTGSVPNDLDLVAFSLGAARRLWRAGGARVVAGGRVTLHLIPTALEPFYGGRTPVALIAYLRVAPTAP
jgi:hypothetical protein